LDLKEGVYESLVAILGPENVSRQDFALITYDKGRWVSPISVDYKPDIVVLPVNTTQVAEIVRLVNKEKVPLTPWGSGTCQSGGAAAIQGGILMDMRKMNRVLEIDEESLAVTVEAGTIISDLNDVLRERGLAFFHDPGGRYSATIGGSISVNSIGSFAMKYGKIGDMTLSLEVVLPTGEVIKTGANVYAQSAGYNLTRLFVGAEGTLGIITKATLKVVPMPEAIVIDGVKFSDINSVLTCVQRIIGVGLEPDILEAYDAARFGGNLRAHYERKYGKSPRIPRKMVILMMGFAGSPEVVKAERETTLKICREFGGELLETEIVDSWWKAGQAVDINP